MINVGDRIVYPMHGAGIVEKIEKKDFMGTKMDYCVLDIKAKNLKVMFPVKRADELNIRPIADLDEIVGVVKESLALEPDADENWNKRHRRNVEKIKTGKVRDVAEVLVLLEKLELSKGLSTGEKQLYHTTFDILASEIVLIEDNTYEDASAFIHELISDN